MQRFVATILLLFLLASCNLGADPPTITPDFPTIEFLYPQNGQPVVEGTSFGFEILAQDNSVGIEKIELYIDSFLVQEAFAENPPVGQYPVTINWTAQNIGFHPVLAVAYRPDGTKSQETTIHIEVIAAPPTAIPDFPTIQFLSPQNGQTIVEGTSFDFEILAQDNSVGIEKIKVYIDGHLVQDAFAENPPVGQYLVRINWTAQDIGVHHISVTAYRPDGTPSQETTIYIEVIAPQ